ncbi:MAG TPA: carboxymuconolactone decarboxylase family protein [Alphaproteobacteria bacterium]|jgi:AhpD family alkylhydroperoxidase
MNDVAAKAPNSATKAVDYQREIPDILQRMASLQGQIEDHGIDRKLLHLVKLRASQINRCAFCVKMHTKEARDDGETNERLDRLVVWKHVGDFSEREKAALAWTDALTGLDKEPEPARLRARLRAHFSDREIGALTAAVAMINFWNRIAISTH